MDFLYKQIKHHMNFEQKWDNKVTIPNHNQESHRSHPPILYKQMQKTFQKQ